MSKGSGLPIDQALNGASMKPEKCPGEIIGNTTQKSILYNE